MKALKRLSRRFWVWILRPMLLAWGLIWGMACLFPPSLDTHYSQEILDREGTLLQAFLSADEKWRLKTPPETLPGYLRDWIICKEDQYFYQHPGINPVSIFSSLIANLRAGRVVTGASTITMQAVRMARPQARTLRSKLEEACLALYWEMALSKEEILEYYLSHLPFGGNREGFRSGSWFYFGKEPNQLSPGEAACLVVIPNHPNRYHPIRNPEALEKRRQQFLETALSRGQLDSATYRLASTEPIQATFHPLPAHIPHLARRLRNYHSGDQIQSTVSLPIQLKVQTILERHWLRWKSYGIHNASALVANSKTGEILAWVGNPDWGDTAFGGKLDAVRAYRSPGSTLKPFIYAQALQKGRITPGTRLPDLPEEFGSYRPENFDETYHGLVRADNALLQSLNVPAIRLLQELEPDSFARLCQDLGMRHLVAGGQKPGLSLAVGGCQTNLLELVSAYTIFCQNPNRLTLRAHAGEKEKGGPKMLSEPALAMVRRMLALPRRGEALRELSQNLAGYEKVFWKTGTSFGRKDAWCIGAGNHLVAGVWFGNLDGTGVPALSGVDVAAPVFQELVAHLDKPSRGQRHDTPENWGWKKRKVCSETGLPPGPVCFHQEWDWFWPLFSSVQPCGHMKAISTRLDGKESYCQACMPENGTRSDWFFQPIPGWLEYCQLRGIPETRPLAPPHNPRCAVLGTTALRILRPAEGRRYGFRGTGGLPMEIRIQASPDAYPIGVFLNGRFQEECQLGHKTLLSLPPGKHRLTAQDRFGGRSTVQFWVEAGESGPTSSGFPP